MISMKTTLKILFCMLVTLSTVNARIWTDLKGNTFEAELVGEIAGSVYLKGSTSKKIKVLTSKLSEADRYYIKQKKKDQTCD